MSVQKANLEKKTKNTLFSTKNVKKSYLFGIFSKICAFFLFILCLCGCAKNASETAAEASLSQVNAIEQQIKKDCPTVNYDKQMESLRNSIRTQLATCEAQKDTLKERNDTLLAILIGLIAIIAVINFGKIKRLFHV